MFIKKRLHIHMCIVQKKDLKEIPQRVNDEFSLGQGMSIPPGRSRGRGAQARHGGVSDGLVTPPGAPRSPPESLRTASQCGALGPSSRSPQPGAPFTPLPPGP